MNDRCAIDSKILNLIYFVERMIEDKAFFVKFYKEFTHINDVAYSLR